MILVLDGHDCLIIKISRSCTPTKHQLADKLEAQTGSNFPPKTNVSEKNCLLQLSFACEHISGNIGEWEWVLLNPAENLWTDLD